MSGMVKVMIDGVEMEVDKRLTLLQACELAGAEVPRFCFHDRLSIAGNCRMCLVEVARAPKPVASCAQPLMDGMVVRTRGPVAGKAQKAAMEFLLINHPLDCPICDQGGECDLQDQAMGYGKGVSRFDEQKRSVPEKDFGPLVKTFMTRCIHCTRCVRFMEEVAGVPVLGATGRGEDTEITTYIEKGVASEMSGNIIDLCPVGALTSKPYAFIARPWELSKTESIDVMDAVGGNIRLDSRGREVLRVLPRLHEDVNEEWISDKTRFAIDGLTRRRLDRPYVRRDGKLREASWRETLDAVAERLGGRTGSRIAAIAGDQVDCETMYAAKALLTALGSPNMDCRQDGMAVDPSVRASYLFNATIAGIEDADACLLIGCDPRREAASVNARLRKRWLRGGFEAAGVGPAPDLTFPVTILGAGPESLRRLMAGEGAFAPVLAAAERPLIVVGPGALARPDGAAVLGAVRSLAESCGAVFDGWNGFSVLHTSASRVGGLDLGFAPGAGGGDTAGILGACGTGEVDTVFLLAADGIDPDRFGDAFVVYIGHHGDVGARRADAILPGAAYTEKDATYVNTEGRPQRAEASRVSSGRSAGGLARSPRSVRCPRRAAPVRQPRGLAREDDRGDAASRRGRRDRSGGMGAVRRGRRDERRLVRVAGPGLLPNMRDQPRVDHDGALRRGLRATVAGCGPGRPTVTFIETWVWPAVLIALSILAILVPVLIAVAYLTYAERKVMAAMQLRMGPNVVGPFGLLQPIADGAKLFLKETIVPTGANTVVFIVAPMITFVLAMVGWGGDPVRRELLGGLGSGRSERRRAVSLRGFLARRLRRHHGWLGLELEVRLLGRPALGRPDGLLRSLNRLRLGRRAGLRRFAQSGGRGARAGRPRLLELVCPTALPLGGYLLRLGAGRDEPRALRPAGGGIGTRLRLQCRILVDDVRAFLPGRVRQHDPVVGAGRHAVPRRMAAALRRSRRSLGFRASSGSSARPASCCSCSCGPAPRFRATATTS